ncbi:MAG: oligosaccharide flippase family protein [Candidatus Thermoplasmatota archaeon]
MSTEGRVLRNTGIVLGVGIASKLIGALFVLWIARYLGSAGFGTYTFALSFASVFVVFADFGLDALAIREVARARPEHRLREILLLRLLLAGIIAIALTLAALVLVRDALLVVLLGGAASLVDKIGGTYYALFRGHERMELEGAVQLTWRGVQISLGAAVILTDGGLVAMMLALLCAALIRLTAAVLLSSILPASRRPVKGWAMRWAGAAVPFAVYELTYAVYAGLVPLALYLLSTPEQVGWFGAAQRTIGFVVLIPLSLEAAIYPVLSRLYRDGQEVMRRGALTTMRLLLFFAVPAGFVIATLSSDITLLLFGRGYDPLPLAVLGATLPVIALNAVLRSVLWSCDLQGRAALNLAVSTLVLGGVLYLLICMMDGVGALIGAVSLALAESMLLILGLWAAVPVLKTMRQWLWQHAAAGCMAVSVCFSIYTFTAGALAPWLLGVIGAIAYAACALALKGVDRADVRLLSSGLRGAFRRPG